MAAMFETMADIMAIQGENAFRVSMYRKVARVIGDMVEDIEKVAREGGLKALLGIGGSTAQKIEQYLATGKMDRYESLMASIPAGVLELLRIPGVGPKTVGRLLSETGVKSVDELERAIQRGDVDGMAGMGDKTIENIQKGIDLLKRSRGRTLLGEALPLAEQIIGALQKTVALAAAEPAGSLRRRKETVGDIDILVTVEPPKGKRAKQGEVPGGEAVVRAFASLDNVAEVLASGGTKGSIRTREGLQVDLRVVPPESFGAALQYFTGSKDHNVKLRGLAQTQGLKINEYGVFKGKKRVAGASEEDVYGGLGLPWIPPELREDRGEVEAAAEGRLPALVTLHEIRGDLHVHTSHSDGNLSVLEMARAAQSCGYSYVALADHSKNLTIANGLDEDQLARKNEEIDEANARLKGFTILKGAEVDILTDGSLDYDDDVLSGLDVVIASVHDHFHMGEQSMTARIVRAIRNPHVHVIGHLTGRLIGQRDGYPVHVSAVIEACAETGTLLEVNAYPERLDINDVTCREAKQAGVRVALGTDAHQGAHLQLMQFGVATARRGWLEKRDVVNCMTAKQLLRGLSRVH